MIDPTKLTIKDAISLIASKQLKAAELVSACLDRAQKFNKKLNSFLTITADYARAQAEKIDKLITDNQKLPELAGTPIALKDLYSTKDIKTTAGSKVLANYTPVYDATTVTKLKDAGVAIVGKTNLDAWGHGASGENSDFGPSRNPFDQSRVPGGSSSGSAIAVATGASLFAMGTDTGGSIRFPASFCNLVGMKPTYGRVSRYGVIAMASSLDTMGHFTKTVYDNALVLNVTVGADSFDATASQAPAEDYTRGIDRGVKGLKIGIPREYFQNLSKDIKEKVLSAVRILEKSGAIINNSISLPHTEYGVACYYLIQPSEVSSNLARYDGIRFGYGRQNFGAEAKRRIILGTFALSSGYYDAYYAKAMKVRRLIREDFVKVFSKVDALICPVSPTLPFKLGEKVSDPLSMYLSDIFTVNANLAGVPSLAVPCGFVQNLPVGFQLIGPDFSEKLLYRVAYTYEQETKWYQRTPKL